MRLSKWLHGLVLRFRRRRIVKDYARAMVIRGQTRESALYTVDEQGREFPLVPTQERLQRQKNEIATIPWPQDEALVGVEGRDPTQAEMEVMWPDEVERLKRQSKMMGREARARKREFEAGTMTPQEVAWYSSCARAWDGYMKDEIARAERRRDERTTRAPDGRPLSGGGERGDAPGEVGRPPGDR